MTQFRKNSNGKAYPINSSSTKPTRLISKENLKELKAKADKAHLHGVIWAGYILNMADNERLKHLNKLVNRYGKKEATDELLYMLAKYQGKPRAETVLKSDLSYIKYGKFEED